jgi:deoxyribodipyrimidine photo-lyase
MWFRRDLRVDDNAALYHALKSCQRVHCVFVFDTAILGGLPRKDRRLTFIWESIRELGALLAKLGGSLLVRHGEAKEIIPAIAQELKVDAVYANHDYEPEAIARDAAVCAALAQAQRSLLTFKDQVIFEKDELLTATGNFYSVYTPYKNNWLKRVSDFYLKAYPVQRYASSLAPGKPLEMPPLEQIGFDPQFRMPIETGTTGAKKLFSEFLKRMDDYQLTRDFPAIKGPSYLSVHLRFGTISIRTLARAAWLRAKQNNAEKSGASVWLSELIWRDFYFQVLHHRPDVVDRAFKPEYDRIQWSNDKTLFQAWCDGKTGYPLVDAAMTQLNTSGYMHNRLRMVVASFLTKDLGIDWRWGEQYFAEKLNDFDLSANNGGWQWAASSGCDAQPYFRIFNPISQSERFDKDGQFIKRYVPQLAKFSAQDIHAPWLVEPMLQRAANCIVGVDYPAPVVAHDEARRQTLARYAIVKKN